MLYVIYGTRAVVSCHKSRRALIIDYKVNQKSFNKKNLKSVGMTLAKVKEQDGMTLAKVKEQDGMTVAK